VLKPKKKQVLEHKKEPDPYGVDRSEAEPAAQAESESGAAETGPFTASVQSGVQIITFEKASVLDAYEIEKLGDAIYHRIKPLEAPKVVIDLSHVDHLSSAALGMLIALRRVVVEKKGGGMAVANVSKDLHAIFKMTKLDKLTKMCASTEKAVQSLV
jgi:anti-sigma B factor antagonist